MEDTFFHKLFKDAPSWKFVSVDQSSIAHTYYLRCWNDSSRTYGVFSEVRDNYHTSIYEWFAYFLEGTWKLNTQGEIELFTKVSINHSSERCESVRPNIQTTIISPKLTHQEDNSLFKFEKDDKEPNHPPISFSELTNHIRYPQREELEDDTWTNCQHCDLWNHRFVQIKANL